MITELDRMAREAGLPVVGVWVEGGELATHASPELRKFAALVAEHCAGICAGHAAELASDDWNSCTRHCAGAIRAAFKEAP